MSLAAVAALVGACGGSDKPEATPDPATTTSTASSTTSEAPAASGSGQAGTVDAWDRDAVEYRGRDGERFKIECTPPPGKPSALWGVETYTDDSSICSAAVHVGLITFADGGEVEIEIGPGQDSYEAGTAHDVTSTRFGPYGGSFFFPAAPPGSGQFSVPKESWQRNAVEYRDKEGEQITLTCSPGGPLGSVWGTGTYTADSSICSAAVHAGIITLDAGGRVTIKIAPGEDSYRGTTANGVTTTDYGSYDGSFTFPDQ